MNLYKSNVYVLLQLSSNLLYEVHAFGQLNTVGIVHEMRNVEFTAEYSNFFQSIYINVISDSQYCL